MENKVHFIGIGGIGMSAIARMYLTLGFEVQGSDIKRSPMLNDLEKLGAKILIGHDSAHINGAGLVVYSSSIQENHPERQAAVKNGLPIIHRAEALAKICEGKLTIAVSGTHGKTTTTALIGMILKEAGRDPSIVVGGVVDSFGGNAYYGSGNEIVIEADESDSSFLKFSPALQVVTNIEKEHMDHYKSMEEVKRAYREFIRRLPENGHWFGCAEDPKVREMARENIRPCTLYGLKRLNDGIYATDIEECPEGKRGIWFKAWVGQNYLGTVRMNIMGQHNVLNALAALGVAMKLHIPFYTISAALEKYEGAERRFDVKYEDSEYLVVDDYAHHPTEIQKTLIAAKGLNRQRVVALFQPHRYTRTKALLQDFGKSFFSADKVIITDIYAASEMPLPGLSGETVKRTVAEAGHPDVSFIERSKAREFVEEIIKPGDLFITLGAGDITQLASEVASDFRKIKGNLARPDGQNIFQEISGKILENEPLSRHTSLRVGGVAQFWIEPRDEEDLRKALLICREARLNVHIFGLGSNLLAPDEGLKGAALHLTSEYFRKIWQEDGKIIARAGVPNSLFIQFVVENNFGDCEFLLGIPGSIGGSIRMNAGSHGGSIDRLIESITLVQWDGTKRILKKEEIPFGYRTSGILDGIITEAVFKLPHRDRAETLKKLEEYREYRAKTQDLQHASAGCMFKNPKDSECSSGKLIEDAGLKGKRVGNAQVSMKHANFIINLGGASSKDILTLIQEVKEAVRNKFGVELESEVKLLGGRTG